MSASYQLWSMILNSIKLQKQSIKGKTKNKGKSWMIYNRARKKLNSQSFVTAAFALLSVCITRQSIYKQLRCGEYLLRFPSNVMRDSFVY